jgi:hypothetical protein
MFAPDATERTGRSTMVFRMELRNDEIPVSGKELPS